MCAAVPDDPTVDGAEWVNLKPRIAWTLPEACTPGGDYARGEDSEEVTLEDARESRNQPAHGPNPRTDPVDPFSGDLGSSLPPKHTIPLMTAAAAAAEAAAVSAAAVRFLSHSFSQSHSFIALCWHFWFLGNWDLR